MEKQIQTSNPRYGFDQFAFRSVSLAQRWSKDFFVLNTIFVMIFLMALSIGGRELRADGNTAPQIEMEGRLTSPCLTAAIASQPDQHPLFSGWAVGVNAPIECEFEGPSHTEFIVFIGLNEDHWNQSGKRLIDIEINGTVVASKIDTFKEAKGKGHGYIFPCRTNDQGTMTIRILPNVDAPDKNPTLCGIIVFPENTEIDVNDVIKNRAYEPIVTLLGISGFNSEEERLRIENRGFFFSKRKYKRQPIPVFSKTRSFLPEPVFDENPDYVQCYWEAWELAFDHFRQPMVGSPFVSNYIDEAFNPSLFLWDTSFMTMFCNYAHPYVPGIQSLDNFYCSQLADGEIVREIGEADGVPNPASQPGTADSLNHPILAWAEVESYRISGDKKRLAMVYDPLVRYYRSYDKILDQPSGFYLGTWASMDNSPRLDSGTMLCGIDTTAEMVVFARDLAYIASQLGRYTDAERFECEAENLARKINEKLWDEETGFYYDWTKDGQRLNVRTIGAFWTLLGHIPTIHQAERLVEHLQSPNEFKRLHVVPTVAASEPTFDPKGGYWRGAVWSPTTAMVVRGLERYGYDDLAKEIAMNHLENVIKVFMRTGTLWENYAPDFEAPGEFNGEVAKRDFVGWTGISPIVFLLEHAIGIKIDAPSNTIRWHITSSSRVGVRNLWFGGKKVSLICEAPDANGNRKVLVETESPFKLVVELNGAQKDYDIVPGEKNEFTFGETNKGTRYNIDKR